MQHSGTFWSELRKAGWKAWSMEKVGLRRTRGWLLTVTYFFWGGFTDGEPEKWRNVVVVIRVVFWFFWIVLNCSILHDSSKTSEGILKASWAPLLSIPKTGACRTKNTTLSPFEPAKAPPLFQCLCRTRRRILNGWSEPRLEMYSIGGRTRASHRSSWVSSDPPKWFHDVSRPLCGTSTCRVERCSYWCFHLLLWYTMISIPTFEFQPDYGEHVLDGKRKTMYKS